MRSETTDSSAAVIQCLLSAAPELAHAFETPGITEIAINDPDRGEFWVEGEQGWELIRCPSLSYDRVRSLSTAIATRTIGWPDGLVDSSLPTGERVAIVSPPFCEPGRLVIDFRRHVRSSMSHSEFREAGGYRTITNLRGRSDEEEARLLQLYQGGDYFSFMELAVRSRKTVIIGGATGFGKTTYMNALIRSAIPSWERLISIEDTRELLFPEHPNTVNLLFKKDREGGETEVMALMEMTLRLKPTRILLGETRGAEAFALLFKMLSGHPGSMTCIHGGSVAEVADGFVLRACMSDAGSRLKPEWIERLFWKVVDVIVVFGVEYGPRGEMFRSIRECYYNPDRKRSFM